VVEVRRLDALRPSDWVDVRLRWCHPDLDAALLEITPSANQTWTAPERTVSRIASLGGGKCSANGLGFPDAAIRRDRIRGAEPVQGLIMSAGIARSKKRLVPFDIDTSVPEHDALWKGYSGTVLIDDHDRLLVALVVAAQPGRSRRRLMVLPIEAIAADPGFVAEAEKLGVDPTVEDRAAPVWAANVVNGSRTASGIPMTVGRVDDLSVLGVHRAVAGGRAFYRPYVPRARLRSRPPSHAAAATWRTRLRHKLQTIGRSFDGVNLIRRGLQADKPFETTASPHSMGNVRDRAARYLV
jgi:hypothetical protein